MRCRDIDDKHSQFGIDTLTAQPEHSLWPVLRGENTSMDGSGVYPVEASIPCLLNIHER